MIQNSFKQMQPSTYKKPKREFADLHMHSILSDGALTVHELIDLSVLKKVNCISITDHDNLDSYEIGKDYAKERGIELVPGIEISAVHEGKDVHVLGYFFDVHNLALNMELAEQVKNRQTRVRQILKKLDKLGIQISMEKVASIAGTGVMGRPHIAQAMLEEEYVNSFTDAFNDYLGETGQAFVEKKGLSVEQAIELIRRAGGISVLAHPMKSGITELIDQMAAYGLGGIETYCHGQKGGTGKLYRDYARKHDLVCSGGSDFHHANHGNYTLGSLKMPMSVVHDLRSKLETQKSTWF